MIEFYFIQDRSWLLFAKVVMDPAPASRMSYIFTWLMFPGKKKKPRSPEREQHMIVGNEATEFLMLWNG